MAWIEHKYHSKYAPFRWKIKWRLEHLGALGIMGGAAPLTVLSTDLLSPLPCGYIDGRICGQTDSMGPLALKWLCFPFGILVHVFLFFYFPEDQRFTPKEEESWERRQRRGKDRPPAHSPNPSSNQILVQWLGRGAGKRRKQGRQLGLAWQRLWVIRFKPGKCSYALRGNNFLYSFTSIFYTLSLSVSFTSIFYTAEIFAHNIDVACK